MKRQATAIWKGQGLTGQGELTTPSGALKTVPYGFKARFESEDGRAGTNPEELIAAAHAGCFSMALAFGLANAGFTAERLETIAEITMAKQDVGWRITGIALRLRASVPGIPAGQFQDLARAAKEGCPISNVLAAVPITLTAELA